MASMRKLKNNLYGEEGRNLTCSIANGDSTYGWFSDTTIIEEPYVVAKNVTYETLAEECPDLLTTASDAKDYLIAEGFEDLADSYYYNVNPGLRYMAIHAANSLMDIKDQLAAAVQSSPNPQRGFANCVLQAIGYYAMAELIGNFANMSRTAIIRAVSKLIMKRVGWIGAAIAVISFVDCITD